MLLEKALSTNSGIKYRRVRASISVRVAIGESFLPKHAAQAEARIVATVAKNASVRSFDFTSS
jgi:hypothetical protein